MVEFAPRDAMTPTTPTPAATPTMPTTAPTTLTTPTTATPITERWIQLQLPAAKCSLHCTFALRAFVLRGLINDRWTEAKKEKGRAKEK